MKRNQLLHTTALDQGYERPWLGIFAQPYAYVSPSSVWSTRSAEQIVQDVLSMTAAINHAESKRDSMNFMRNVNSYLTGRA
ncbi:MAG: hypothetical protein ACYDD1_05405 [Caulobacteraceae bacterium]